jgi:hypothetical protein
MGAVVMELHRIENECFWQNCTIYMVSYNFATHATYLLTFMVYKYSELQVSFATQNLVARPITIHNLFLIVFYFPPTILHLYIPIYFLLPSYHPKLIPTYPLSYLHVMDYKLFTFVPLYLPNIMQPTC